MNEERMLKPALIGGVLLGILSSIPVISLFNCVCCAWVIGGGVLAAYLYVKDSPIPVTLGRGVGLGLFTGFIGTIVNAVFMIPLYLLMDRVGMGVVQQIKQALERVPNLPPEAEAALRSISGEGGLGIFLYIAGFILTLVINCLVAMLGGAIGVAIFEKRKPGAAPMNTPYQEPPVTLPPPPPPDTP
jgi:hypothetical protein